MPEIPDTPSTSWNPDDVTVSWSQPIFNGDEITSYTILFRTSDYGVYKEEKTNCDGSNPIIRNANSCTIPVSILKAAPFSLPWGADITVKIIATNTKGDSDESNPGSGAIITTIPDKPINLIEDIEYRTSSTLGLSWEDGLDNGGDVIYDYRIYFKQVGGAYSLLVSGVVNKYYTATQLTFGITYVFKVQARNSYGYSLDS